MVLDGRKPMLNRQRWTVTWWRSAAGNGKHPPPPPRSLARAVNSRQHSVLIWFVLQWQQGKPLCKQGTE